MSSLDIRPLHPALAKIARDELNEDPDKNSEFLEAFREWINKTPHLKARTDDQYLMTFLRGSKFSLNRAQQKIEMHYTLR